MIGLKLGNQSLPCDSQPFNFLRKVSSWVTRYDAPFVAIDLAVSAKIFRPMTKILTGSGARSAGTIQSVLPRLTDRLTFDVIY